MRIYIAGPMTGYTDYNYPAFTDAAAHLRSLGYDVVSPHEINALDDDGHPWDWFMRRDIAELVTADAVCVLPGWGASRGATLETHIAAALGMPIYAVEEMSEASA